jgi:hypothetical protein
MTLHVSGSGEEAITRTKGLFEGSQQDPGNSGLVEELEIVVLLGPSAVAVGEKELQLSLPCRRLGPARDVDEERVPDVDKDQADSICPSCGKCPGGAVADEAQLGDRCFHFEAGLLGHNVGVVEHVGHGANCHPGAPRDILDAWTAWPEGVAILESWWDLRLCHAGQAIPGLLI